MARAGSPNPRSNAAYGRWRLRAVGIRAAKRLRHSVTEVDKAGDRLIVFTDEQSHDAVPAPKGRGYLVNVTSYQHGVGNGPWRRVDGFSEAVIAWIAASEDAQ